MNKHAFTTGRLLTILVLLTCASLLASAAPQVQQSRPQPAGQPTLPSQYDLRNVNGTNYVTGIRNQGQYGTCWTHGIMASMEGNLLITGNWAAAGETGEPNLAEAHLDWWNGFNDQNNDDDPGGPGIEVHEGGDYRVGTAYLTRGEGAVREIDAPYSNLVTQCARTSPTYHYYIPHDVEWYVAGSSLSNINSIKLSLILHGVIGTCIDYANFMQNYIQYQPPTDPNPPNHAVAIVGWNDNMVTQAPQGHGAWIAKNSWGNWGPYGGYFYISYYDKCCCQDPQMGAVSFQGVDFMNQSTKIYYHDYHGWRDTFAGATEVFNAFTATRQDALQAVSFFTAADNASYTVKIYKSYESGQLQNEVASESGIFPYLGFHTVDLSHPIGLAAGSNFYVYLSLSPGGIPFDRTSDVPVLLGGSSRTVVHSIAHPGESYYKNGNTWTDLYGYHFSNSSWDGTANFCVKAMTNNASGDLWPPVTTCSLNGTLQGGVYLGDVQVSLHATDNLSGVAQTNYSLDGGSWTTYVDSFIVAENGPHVLRFYSTDYAGNVEPVQTAEFTIQPSLTITGGFGLKVTVKNVGSLNLTDVPWNVSMKKGLVLLGRSGHISLATGEETTVRSVVFGLGRTDVTFTIGPCEKTTAATIFLFFVITG